MTTTRALGWVLLGSAMLLSPAARAQDASILDASPLDAAVPDAHVPCGDVDTLGQCQGALLRVCTDGSLTETDCLTRFGTGFSCVLTEPLLAAQCVFIPDDAGPPRADAGVLADAGGISIYPPAPTTPTGGCGCLKPAWGQGALMLTGLVMLRPGRRRRR